MGKLTTHVLDTTRGKPGHGIRVALFGIAGEQHNLIKYAKTNDDGRCDEPLLDGEQMQIGIYELVFSVGAYFAALESASHVGSDSPRFLDDVVIRFGIAAPEQHYHVPLLISPYSYSTYRGS